MRSFFVALLSATSLAAEDIKAIFVNWMAKQNKSYSTLQDFLLRYKQFNRIHDFIQKMNSEYDSVTYGHNQFSDWTEEEWGSYLNLKAPESL